MMKRKLYRELLQWKSDKNRKPLLIKGARQTGKTFLINEFGENEYQNLYRFNFEKEPGLKSIFSGNLNPRHILEALSAYSGKKIDPRDSLLFFDEIQANQQAITSLKYFYEEMPGIHLIAAGSLLGVSLGKTSSFPVGKVTFKQLLPLSFEEYLWASNEQILTDYLHQKKEPGPIPEVLHDKLKLHLRKYLFLGGMPEVLNTWYKTGDFTKARAVQNEIIEGYLADFSKYSLPNQAIKTAAFWNSVPYQLARENKKFKYSDVRKKARASYFENTIDRLNNAGLIYPAYRLKNIRLPLKGYADYSQFKVYMFDTGLLGALLSLSARALTGPDTLFKEYNGAFIENFVACELRALGEKELYYWTSEGKAEVDFIVQWFDKILPVEVKSGTNKNLQSLRIFDQKYVPPLLIRLSPRNYMFDNQKFINFPLYGLFHIKNLIEKAINVL